MENRKKILVAEDAIFFARTYETKLHNEGYSIIKAVDGEETVTLAKSEHPDLIILDLIMPKKSGFEALTEIKADPETKDIPIIILSNLDKEEAVQQGLIKGASDYLVKTNTTIDEVMEKIATYLK